MARHSSRISSNARMLILTAAFAILGALTGCGGGGSADSSTTAPVSQAPVAPVVPTPPAPVAPATIDGVATPDSVSVVTATNAG